MSGAVNINVSLYSGSLGRLLSCVQLKLHGNRQINTKITVPSLGVGIKVVRCTHGICTKINNVDLGSPGFGLRMKNLAFPDNIQTRTNNRGSLHIS